MIKSSRTTVMMLLLVSLVSLATPSGLHAVAPAKGMFLVADEGMVDPRFKAGVILLIRHDADGSAGLIINRSSRLPLDAVLPKETRLDSQGRKLSYGGPVEPGALLALVKVHNTPPQHAEKILANLYLTGVAMLDQWPGVPDEVIDYRAFAGYAGWAPGQLDGEMQSGSWHLVPADEESVFAGQDEGLWERLQSGIAAGK
jgi:putative transcriptional regulator